MPHPDSALARALGRWVTFCARRWPWVLAATVLVTGALFVYVARNLGIQTNLDGMLDPDLPFRRAQARYERQFPQFASQLVMVVEAETPEDARAAAQAAADALGGAAELFTHVAVPRAHPFLESHGLLYLDEDELYDLSDRLARVQPFLGRLTRDPSLRGLFDMLDLVYEEAEKGGAFDASKLARRLEGVIDATLDGETARLSWQELMDEGEPSPDDHRQYVLVQVRSDDRALFPVGEGIRRARALFEEATDGLPGAPRLRITGSIAMEHEELATVRRGAEGIGLLTMLLVGAALALGLRSVRLVLASLLALVVGLVVTAAFATFAVGHLNLISVAFGVLYIGLGVDYAIHLCLRYREAVEAGRPTIAALEAAARDVGGSLFLCTLTTAIGFYAFVPTAYRGVSELGLISGTGMFVSLVVSLSFLPALLAAFPLDPTSLRRRAAPRGWMAALVDVPIRHRRIVLVGGAVLAAGALFLLPRARFDLNPLNLRDPGSESVQTFRELVATSETPPWSIQVLADSFEEAARESERLAALDSVDRVVTLDSFVPEGQEEKAMLLDDLLLSFGPTLRDLEPLPAPGDDEVSAALARLEQRLDGYLDSSVGNDDRAARELRDALGRLATVLATPDGSRVRTTLVHAVLDTLPVTLDRLDRALRARPFGPADLPSSLALDWRSPGDALRIEVFPRENLDDIPALRRFVQAVQDVVPDATGAPVAIVESGRAIVSAFRQAVIVSVAACSLVLLLLLRRPGSVLLVLVPLLFAGVVTGASTVLLDLPFNFANVIAIPLLFGIGVDSGIHVVHRARGRLPASANGNPVRTSTGRAVVFSALTTVCSFGSLAFSPHPGTASMGLLLAIGVATTVLATLWLLPALATVRRPATSA